MLWRCDADPCYGAPTASSAQQGEAAQRTAADLRWLDMAFALANADAAGGVVVVTRADMWDLDGKTPAHLAKYEPIVSSLASHTTGLGQPVLLFTGDSHTYRSDNPLRHAGRARTTLVCAAMTRGAATRTTRCRTFTAW